MTVSRQWWERTGQGATYQARLEEERASDSRLRAESRREHVYLAKTSTGAMLSAVDESGRIVAVRLGMAQLVELIAEAASMLEGEA
jgi:hypothetical protein